MGNKKTLKLKRIKNAGGKNAVTDSCVPGLKKKKSLFSVWLGYTAACDCAPNHNASGLIGGACVTVEVQYSN